MSFCQGANDLHQRHSRNGAAFATAKWRDIFAVSDECTCYVYLSISHIYYHSTNSLKLMKQVHLFLQLFLLQLQIFY